MFRVCTRSPAFRTGFARAFEAKANPLPGAKQQAFRSIQTAVRAQPNSSQTLVRGAVGAASVAGVVGLCLMGEKAVDNTSGWQAYVSERVSSTYGYLGGGLALTAASAYALSHSQAVLRIMATHPMATGIGGFVVCMGAMMGTRSIPYENFPAKMGAWVLFNTAMGATLVPICFLGGPVIAQAAAYTGVVVGGLSLVSMSARSDQFLSWGPPLAAGLGIVFVTALGTYFLPARFAATHGVMNKVVIYGGMVIFSGFVLYDTQKIVYKAKYNQVFDPVNESVHIYLDVINLFTRIVFMLSGNRRK